MKIIEGKIIDTYKDGDFINFIFSTEIDGNTIYWTIEHRFLRFNDTPSFNSDTVQIEWDGKKYTAKLIVSEDKKPFLDRYFFHDEKFEDKFSHIEVVKCPSCGSNISLGNKKEIVCPACNTHFTLSDERFKDILTAADVKRKNAILYKDILKLFSVKEYRVLLYITYYLFVFQVFLIAIYLIFPDDFDFIYDFFESGNFVNYLALPSFLFTIFTLFITRRNVYDKNILTLLSLFSPVIIDKDTFRCRNCGSPLKYDKIPDIVVCPYCKSENVVLPHSVAKMKKKLNFNLIDIRILHRKFDRNAVNTFFRWIGIELLYGFYFIYTLYLNRPDVYHFLVKYLEIPFVVFSLFGSLFSIAFYEYTKYNVIDLLPEKLREGIEKVPDSENFTRFEIVLKKIAIIIGIIAYLFFVTAQFFISSNF